MCIEMKEKMEAREEMEEMGGGGGREGTDMGKLNKD